MLTILSGIIASIAHVLTGPDHLAAVTPLAIDSRNKSWFIGLLWGCGHTIGMLLIGLLFLLFRELIPIEKISAYSDKIIGFLLIIIGAWAVARTYLRHSHGNVPHVHFHNNSGMYVHIHRHTHTDSDSHNHVHTGTTRQHHLTALGIGVVHGFAGFSHLLALLPLLALPSWVASFTYITSFATGTILTMIIFALIMGLIAYKSVQKGKHHFLKWFTLSGGGLAILIGIYWIFRSSI
jgi:ABC-type nickel/cobalt efflux system permease component RcnA